MLAVRPAVSVDVFDWGRYLGDGEVTGAPVSSFKHVSSSPQLHLGFLYMRLTRGPGAKCGPP